MESIFGLSFDYLIWLSYSTFAMAIGFGVAWPLKAWAERKLDVWQTKPLLIKHLYAGVFIAIIGIILVVGILDVALNSFVSLLFKRLPEGKVRVLGIRLIFCQFLTTRIQQYLYEWSDGKTKFNLLQRLYIRAVAKIANKIDRTPHFIVPKNIR